MRAIDMNPEAQSAARRMDAAEQAFACVRMRTGEARMAEGRRRCSSILPHSDGAQRARYTE